MKNNNDKYGNWKTTTSSMYTTPSFDEVGQNEKKREPKLVYGLEGLADFLHQSVTSAWRLKKTGKYNAAISQHGRCIITDTEKLLELMRLDHANKQQEYVNNYYYK